MNEKLTIPTIAEMNAPEFHMKLCENDDKTWERLRLAIQTNYFVKSSWRDILQKCGLNIEDVAQEIVKKLLKSNTYNPEQGSKFTSWLHYVVRTRLIDLYNQWKKQNNGGNIESLDDPIMTNSAADSGNKYERDPHDGGEGAKLLYNHIDKTDPESEAMEQQYKMEKWLEYLNKEEFAKSWQNDPQKTLMLYLRVIGKLYCSECKRNKVQPLWRISTNYLKDFLGVHGEKAVIDNAVHRIREEMESRSCEHGYSFQKTR